MRDEREAACRFDEIKAPIGSKKTTETRRVGIGMHDVSAVYIRFGTKNKRFSNGQLMRCSKSYFSSHDIELAKLDRVTPR